MHRFVPKNVSLILKFLNSIMVLQLVIVIHIVLTKDGGR